MAIRFTNGRLNTSQLKRCLRTTLIICVTQQLKQQKSKHEHRAGYFAARRHIVNVLAHAPYAVGLLSCPVCPVCDAGALWPNGWTMKMKVGKQVGSALATLC